MVDVYSEEEETYVAFEVSARDLESLRPVLQALQTPITDEFVRGLSIDRIVAGLVLGEGLGGVWSQSEHDRRYFFCAPNAPMPLDREQLSRAAVIELLEKIQASAKQQSQKWNLAEARTRNLRRVLKRQAHLLASCIDGKTLQEGLNLSRQRLNQLVHEERIIAIQLHDRGAHFYPFWQFEVGSPVGQPHKLEGLIAASKEADMDMLMLHSFMTGPNDRLEGAAPFELLGQDAIDRVIEVLQSSGLGPA